MFTGYKCCHTYHVRQRHIQYKYVYFYIAGIDFRRQIQSSKVDHVLKALNR